MAVVVVLVAACAPAAAPGVSEPSVDPTGQATVTTVSDSGKEDAKEVSTSNLRPVPTVGPLGQAVSGATDCSSDVAEVEPTTAVEVERLFEHLTLEELIDSASVIVRARGLTREQVNIPVSNRGGTGSEPPCLWVVVAEVEVMEYLQGQGPETLRVVLPVDNAPRPDRPLATVEHRHNINVGGEYVLFLRSGQFNEPMGLGGRNWTVVAESQGRWPVEDGSLVAQLESPEDEMTLDQLRAAISPVDIDPQVLPTPGPLGRAVSAVTECSSGVPGIDEVVALVEIFWIRFSLEALIDHATVIVRARGSTREQVNIPYSRPEGEGRGVDGPNCLWVVFAEVEVMEYLKGQGPDTLRIALLVEEAPWLDRPLARVGENSDVEVGREYVLFLQSREFNEPMGLDDRNWTVVAESQGRWPLDGEDLQVQIGTPGEEMTLDELRAAISR